MQARLKAIANKILSLRGEDKTVFIFPHIGVDGDALGSGLSLAVAFKALNIRVQLLLDEEPMARLAFLPRLELAVKYSPEDLPLYDGQISVAIAVDCHQSSRMGMRAELFDQAEVKIIIDHHIVEGDHGSLSLIKTQASSSSELCFDLIEMLEDLTGEKLFNQDIANYLAVGIITDTGRFSFPSTTARCFEQMGYLMQFQPDLNQINNELYERFTLAQALIKGEVLSRARYSQDGRIIASSVSRELLHKTGADDSDLETLPSELRMIDGVDVAFLLRETGNPGEVRINIRSNSCFDAAAYAMKFAGGGHLRAAGMTLYNFSLGQAEEMVLAEAEELLNSCQFGTADGKDGI